MDAHIQLAEGFGNVDMFRTCEQCGCCASACPITGVKDFNVRRIIRHIEMDLIEEIGRTPFPWYCTTCGRCETVCPNGIAVLDIIRPLRRLAPEEFIPEGPAPCINACPGGIDIPGYLRFITEGKPEDAYRLIMEKVPFPGILGRVCTHPCEEVCRRGEVNEPVSICALKRYVADKGGLVPEDFLKVDQETGHKVAIIGAGPAGLSAAYFLRKKGHKVTIFESRHKAGGMMRYGIPYYRLPEEVVDKEIEQVLSLGIEIKTGVALGKDFDLKGLRDQGYEAVFMAMGLQQSRKIDLEGSDLKDVTWGIDFLTQIGEGEKITLKEKVMVIGGGNVAVDVAMTALRSGAKEVTMASLESREEMPANSWEIEMAIDEGVNIMPSRGPLRVISDNGNVTGIELVKCTSVFDNKGNFSPVFDEAKETVAVDQVILAIGQTTDLSCLQGEGECRIDRDLITVDPETLQTDAPGVFAGGEVVEGPGVIIEAIASSKRAARAIDLFLGGDGVIEKPIAERILPENYDGKREKGFADLQRVHSALLPVTERQDGFAEVELSLDEEQAVKEAARCLQCDFELCLGSGTRQ